MKSLETSMAMEVDDNFERGVGKVLTDLDVGNCEAN
jgi:hypothetical protein